MVLPTEDQTWPPSIWDPVAHAQRLWSAWFAGSADQLGWAYYNLGANSTTGRAFFRTTGELSIPQPRPGQYRGGLLGSVDRYFWGQATPPGEKRSKIHVPVAGDISSMSADLLFAKRPRFDTLTAGGNQGSQDWCENRFDDDLHASLLEAAELCSALGGVYLRSVYDTEISDKPWLDLVHADAAVPEFRHGKLTAVTFWRVLDDDGDDVVRHLEQHDLTNNVIFHGLYQGDQYMLGDPIPVAGYPELEPVIAQLDSSNAIALPDMPPDASSVTYVPNMRPNRIWRDIHNGAPLGRSDYAGIEGIMDSLDETYSAWIREIRLAKARLIVPHQYLDNIGPGKGAVFEPDREVMVPMDLLSSSDTPQITANQFEIRWQQYQNTIAQALEAAVRGAGYSPQTFGDAPTAAMTATEIENRERRTLLTRAKKLNYWRPALSDALYSLMCLEVSVFKRREITPVRPDITFPDAVLPSASELAQTAVALNNADAVSRQTLVAMVHPDWTPEQVDEEVQRMRDEAGFDILGRARTTLTEPMGSTANLTQEIQQIADSVTITPEKDAIDPNSGDRQLQP